MVDVDRLCTACMSDRGDNSICPNCGYNGKGECSPHHLKPGTILAGKYWLGNALGQGGFGITYIGYDLNLEIPVAIKEFFPMGYATRDSNTADSISIVSGQAQEIYEKAKDKFINEAKALAKFDDLSGIVSVKDFFQENGTAYIVMEYLEGETFKAYLERNGGSISADKAITMLLPVMKSLSEVHGYGVIHRDISPDNIMISKKGKIKLLDFGAARDASPNGSRSLSVQLKMGYAPEEQYRTHGKQGPWTDVYAMSATIYRAITGGFPIEALERIMDDILQPPSKLGVKIEPELEQVLMKGLSVKAENRYQDMNSFCVAIERAYNRNVADEVYQTGTVTQKKTEQVPLKRESVPKNNKQFDIKLDGAKDAFGGSQERSQQNINQTETKKKTAQRTNYEEQFTPKFQPKPPKQEKTKCPVAGKILIFISVIFIIGAGGSFMDKMIPLALSELLVAFGYVVLGSILMNKHIRGYGWLIAIILVAGLASEDLFSGFKSYDTAWQGSLVVIIMCIVGFVGTRKKKK